jgi:hypothetical protein
MLGVRQTGSGPLAPFSESLDVMGDGSLMLLPTPGHTPGSVSLLVRRQARSPLLLVGDLSYGADLLERRQLPGVGARRQLAQATHKVLALKQRMPGLVILPAHDPTAAQRLLELMAEATMATFQNTLTIQRPVEDVFAFLADFREISRPGTTRSCRRRRPLPGLSGSGPPTGSFVPSPTGARKASRSPCSNRPPAWRSTETSGPSPRPSATCWRRSAPGPN